MCYLDNDLNICEATETTVYRVFGGESSLEGGYVTPDLPKNPIQARCDLALSQTDFGTRNLASEMATCTMYTDADGRVIDLNSLEPTDDVLSFTTVDSTSDMPGGGMEYHLESPFDQVVQVDKVEELKHQPTDGWLAYVDAEEKVITDLSANPENWVQDATAMNTDEFTSSNSLNTINEDDVCDSQDMDVDSLYNESSWASDVDDECESFNLGDDWYESPDHVVDSLDSLSDDDYESQSNDEDDSWNDAANTSDDSTVNDDYNENENKN